MENQPDSTEAFIQVSKPEEEVQQIDEGDVSSSSPSSGFDPIPLEPLKDIDESPSQNEDEDKPAPAESEEAVATDEKSPEPVAERDSCIESTKELTSCPARWMKERGIDERVIDLIYWRCLKKTGVVFATLLVVLISLSLYTILSVLTFFSMAILTVVLLYRVGMTVMGAIQKSGSEHPLQNLLDKDLEISKDKAVEIVEAAVDHVNCTVKKLRSLFLVEDIVDSIKFGLFLWVLSYFGAWFSALTIGFLGVVVLFTLPKIYEEYQKQIDEYLKVAREKISDVANQIRAKLPAKFQKEKTS